MTLGITDLPEDIITMIIDNLEDATTFVCSCRKFYCIGKGYGYLKHLYYRSGDSLKGFKDKFYMHQRCVKSIVIDVLHDPQHWLPFYPKGIFLNIISVPFDIYSKPVYTFDPDEETYTEILYIIASKFSPCLVKINWKKFKKLRRLHICAHDIDLEGIEYLENVYEISIDCGNNSSYLNIDMVKYLPKLKYININSEINEKTYHDLIDQGIIVNHDTNYNTNYNDLYMYLITGKISIE